MGFFYLNAPKSKILQGKGAEQLFKETILKNNFEYRDSTKKEDIYKHTDCYVKFHQKWRSIDVKSLKKIRGEFQDEKFFIEIKNDYGYPGWLYSNHVQFIAFQTFNGFELYKTKKLRRYFEENKKSLQSTSKKGSPAELFLLERKCLKNLIYKNI